MDNFIYSQLQVKICGINSVDDADAAVRFGASAIGLVFFEKSKRNILLNDAKEICSFCADKISTVGVFVNESISKIVEIANFTGIGVVQLHGNESPEDVEIIKSYGLKVIKAVFNNAFPFFKEVNKFGADAFLIESAGKNMTGGNGVVWNWHEIKKIERTRPIILAGGLNIENISDAIFDSMPDAVDVSSGVEKSPGMKDHMKIEKFIKIVNSIKPNWNIRRVFDGI